MSQPVEEIPLAALVTEEHYDISSLEAEIRADRYCAQLLKHFHRWLLNEQHQEALVAGQFAAGADYFLREFMIGARRENIFCATAKQLRQFGGNWYIVSNLESNCAELEPMLLGTALFYRYCTEQNLFRAEAARDIDTIAHERAFFSKRIEDFHQLQADGYSAWNQACALA